MPNKSEQESSNLPVLTDEQKAKIALQKKQQALAIIRPKMNKIDMFIELSRAGKIEERDNIFGVFTLDRIVNNIKNSLPLSAINAADPKIASLYIKEMFIQFVEQMQFERTLTPGNIEELTAYIKKHHWFYTVADIHLLLDMLKTGKLYEYDINGNPTKPLKLFGSVNIVLMYDAIRSYERQRNDLIVGGQRDYIRLKGKTTDEGKNAFTEAKVKYAQEQANKKKPKTKKQ